MINADTAFRTKSTGNRVLRFYLLRRPLQFWVVFPMLWFYLLFRLHIIGEVRFVTERWSFLKRSTLTQADWIHLKRRLPVRQMFKYAHGLTVYDQIPQFILDILVADTGLDAQGVAIDLHGVVTGSVTTILERMPVAHEQVPLVTPTFYRLYMRKYARDHAVRIYDLNREFAGYKSYQTAQLLWQVRNVAAMLVAAMVVTAIALIIAYKAYNSLMVTDLLFTAHKLFLINVFPVFAIILMVYFLTNDTGWAVGLGGLVFPVLALVNFFMLQYRNFEVEYADLFLAGEAGNMGSRYSYVPPLHYAAMIALVVLLGVILHYLFKAPRRGFWWRIVWCAATVGVLATVSVRFLFPYDYYGSTTVSRGNMWDTTNRAATNGFVYSFWHTIGATANPKPTNYSAAKAKSELNKYTTKSIPKNKRVNVITIQLEAFNDFSKWSQINIDPSVYKGLHTVEKESLAGNLTTTIFAGGTVDTERKVATGYSTLPGLKTYTNSFVDYFDDQGYNTYSAHPGYAWFYNRQNINRYLGYSDRLFKENYYTKNVSAASIINDNLVFPDLIKQINQRTKNGKYVFNQTVTYQNHGPYPTTFSGTPVVKWQSGYNKSDYAVINNYLTGVKKTSDALLALVNKLKKSNKPVVLAFWGDHNPWAGDNNSTYKMLGVDLNLGSQTGYSNYYDTPYVIWANAAAKKRMKKNPVGQGKNISPMYVLPTIFQYAGWKGNQYMQLITEMEKTIPVFGLTKDLYQGKFTAETSLPTSVQTKVNNFKIAQYYTQTEYKK